MRNSIRLSAVSAAAVAAISFASAAQAADTATADAFAEILTTISVNQVDPLLFGQIAVNGDGAIVIGADGSQSCGASLVCTGTRQPGTFLISGTTGSAVGAVVDEASISLTNGTDSFTLDNFTTYWPNGTTLTGAGTTDLAVGGTLHIVAANASPGVYTGQYHVTVEYQ